MPSTQSTPILPPDRTTHLGWGVHSLANDSNWFLIFEAMPSLFLKSKPLILYLLIFMNLSCANAHNFGANRCTSNSIAPPVSFLPESNLGTHGKYCRSSSLNESIGCRGSENAAPPTIGIDNAHKSGHFNFELSRSKMIHVIRGGGLSPSDDLDGNLMAKRGKKKSKKGKTEKLESSNKIYYDEKIEPIKKCDNHKKSLAESNQMAESQGDEDASLGIRVQAILLPRQTSILKPLRFLSFLLMNITFNSCLQTSGKPLEEAVRKILGMPSPGSASALDDTNALGELVASKVTPLHIYVAKKIASSSSLPRWVLPPAHLASPLPLLGLFSSILLFVGGTILAPRWSVSLFVFYNYLRINIQENEDATLRSACFELQQCFEQHEMNDPYFQSNLGPAVLVYEMDSSDEKELSVSRVKGRRKAVVCPLYCSPEHEMESDGSILEPKQQHPRRYYFELDQKRYYYDPFYQFNGKPALVDGGPTFHKTESLSILLSQTYTRGLHTHSQLISAKERYGPYTHISIPIPSIASAFVQRITSPLVSVQLVGKLLSLVEEESVGRSLATVVRLIFQHFMDTKRKIQYSINLAEEVKANEDFGEGNEIWAVRPTVGDEVEWIKLSESELLPGDVFVIVHGKGSNSPTSIPADALILEGTCITEEAALTGESVPQAKVPIELEPDEDKENEVLDMTGNHRNSCIFAGTKLLYCTNDDGKLMPSLGVSGGSVFSQLPPLPKEISTFPVFLSLRTGSSSSRGEIIRSLLKNKNLGSLASELDSIRLISILAVFAVFACASLLLNGPHDDSKDTIFKRIVQCTRIVVAAVPSELPNAISASAHACIEVLRDEDVVCSEAESLLESSKIDCLVFDKTGTLTADTQSLESILYAPDELVSNKVDSLFMSNIVLAGCHTITTISEGGAEIGDPLDIACLKYSKWKYNSHEKSASTINQSLDADEPVKIWQIRSFPFDPNKKMSSAIILVQNNDNSFHLWAVAKGAPDAMRRVVSKSDVESSLMKWYDNSVQFLGELGNRIVCLAAREIDGSIVRDLFPSGLPESSQSHSALEQTIRRARSSARANLHRNDEIKEMTCAGFACFNAPMRESTPRVVNELKKQKMKVIMLTGDGIHSSVVHAAKAGIIDSESRPSVYLLKEESGLLLWETKSGAKPFSLSSATRIEREVNNNKGIIIAEGNAINTVLSETKEGKTKFVQEHLIPKISLVACASPHDKHIFMKWLKRTNRVLMCGDGVNDVAAMKEADVSVAMLSGFADDYSSGDGVDDIGDIHRKERLRKRRIGSNRLFSENSNSTDIENAGIGNSPAASVARIRNRILSAIEHLHGNEEGIISTEKDELCAPSNYPSLFDICFSSIKAEILRYRQLKKGGSDAARILAEEESLRKSILQKSTYKEGENHFDTIETGEACLASTFTLLRPCISGVESILRAGVSAASCGISLYRKIAMNCMLSCYNLATLYKDGLRYGERMWQVELGTIIAIDKASFDASSTSRPRLPGVRPPLNPFHTADVLSTLLQTVVHMVTLTLAVSSGRKLDAQYPTKQTTRGFRIKWGVNSKSDNASAGAVMTNLVRGSASNAFSSIGSEEPHSFFRRSPFVPNHLSNHVFIMSVFQNAVMCLVNHSGRPFAIGVLESRPLCVSVGLTFLLCVTCIAETVPMLNSFLQLAPIPTKSSKVEIMRYLLWDISLSYFAEYISTLFFSFDIWRERNGRHEPLIHASYPTSSADEEETLLYEEKQMNCALISLICLSLFYCSFHIFL